LATSFACPVCVIHRLETVEEPLNAMAESRKQLMELLQGDAGVQFAALEVGWDEVTDGKAD
jgi:hypothetical protein